MEQNKLIGIIIDRIYRHNTKTLDRTACPECFGTGITVGFDQSEGAFVATVCKRECLADGEDLGDVGSTIWKSAPCESVQLMAAAQIRDLNNQVIAAKTKQEQYLSRYLAALDAVVQQRDTLWAIASRGCEWASKVAGYQCGPDTDPKLICPPCKARMTIAKTQSSIEKLKEPL